MGSKTILFIDPLLRAKFTLWHIFFKSSIPYDTPNKDVKVIILMNFWSPHVKDGKMEEKINSPPSVISWEIVCLKNTLIFCVYCVKKVTIFYQNNGTMGVKMTGTAQFRGEPKETVINF